MVYFVLESLEDKENSLHSQIGYYFLFNKQELGGEKKKSKMHQICFRVTEKWICPLTPSSVLPSD